MAQRIIGNKVGYEPVPGYMLRKRLGAGGYGEVWLADAPGGLQKAVKLIYGTVDESHATSELRSLQRIRQVYHPFLLSIERIEIVANQVVIITELAEGSLLDRFEQFRRKDAPGIPRTNLLEYMRDTADALDFLAQKHALQHLDVKPGNLLMIAEHIKVADFGLIKDLHDQNQSLVSGLTPTYSAPEIFDGRPDYRSDQYSLAIVYMEMLTGQLPFPGRTTGELALQHVNQAPNLDALPPADRPVVARALSKNPMDRFATCRQFVEQLLKTRSAVIPSQVAPRSAGKENVDSRRSSTMETVQSPALAGRHVFHNAIHTDQIESNWLNPRAMFIGLGGVGGQALLALRETVNRDCDCKFGVADLGWIAIDTDIDALNKITVGSLGQSIPANSTIQLPIYRPAEYRNAEPDLFGPLSRRWLYNIPRSLKTEGVRPLSILTLLDHYVHLRAKLLADLQDLIAKHKTDAESPEPLRIYLISSLHGGTGSGLLAEVGLLIRRILAELRFSNYRICAMLTAASTLNNQVANLPAAAAIACLSELSYLMDPEHEIPSLYFGEQAEGLSSNRPFDWVTLVDGGLHGKKDELAAALRELANATWLDAQTMIGAALNESRLGCGSQRYGWLRTTATKSIRMTSNVSAQNLARWCCEQTLHHGLRYLTGPRDEADRPARQTADSGNGATLSGDLPLTNQACEEFTRRLLSELGVTVSEKSVSESTLTGLDQRFATKWARRLSNQEELIKAQLAEDVAIWRQLLSKIVQMRVYNWKQIARIQLRVIEGILDFCERETKQLLELCESFSSDAESSEQVLQLAVSYLHMFSEASVKQLEYFQREGQALSDRLASWCDSILAEKALNEAPWEVSLSGLPPRLQLLASRVNTVLESTVHRLALQVVDDSPSCLGLPYSQPHEEGNECLKVNLNYMLSLSTDLVSRISSEIGIGEEEFSDMSEAEGLLLNELAQFYPSLAESGGELDRLVITSAEQHSVLASILDERRLTKYTTLITSTRSLGTHVVCDCRGLEPRQVICTLWRPSPNTLQLSERLRTRVDIDWDSAANLLESSMDAFAESPSQAVCGLPISMELGASVASMPVDT